MKQRLPLLLFAAIYCATIPVFAQNAEEFDRFFTSRATRKQLNQTREQYSSLVQGHDVESGEFEERIFPEIHVKGLIVRNDGSSEIWVNDSNTIGKNRASRDLQSGTRRVDGQRIRITLSDGETVTLKPGQIYTPDSQQVLEAYQLYLPPPQESVPVENETAPESKEPETDSAETDKDEEFDESVLAETDTKIKLLEERIQKLEGQR
jgi:hypothetical protein